MQANKYQSKILIELEKVADYTLVVCVRWLLYLAIQRIVTVSCGSFDTIRIPPKYGFMNNNFPYAFGTPVSLGDNFRNERQK